MKSLESDSISPVSPMRQLALDQICQEVDVGEVTDLPEGAANLRPKEIDFIRHYLRCGRMGEAAKRAGYSEKTAPQIAQNLFKKVHVQRFFQGCVKLMRDNAEQLVARIWQRSMLCQDRILQLEEKRDAVGLTTAEEKRLGKYHDLANKVDTLMAGILNKLPTLNLNVNQTGGEGSKQHFTITTQTQQTLAQVRQQVLKVQQERSGHAHPRS